MRTNLLSTAFLSKVCNFEQWANVPQELHLLFLCNRPDEAERARCLMGGAHGAGSTPRFLNTAATEGMPRKFMREVAARLSLLAALAPAKKVL